MGSEQCGLRLTRPLAVLPARHAGAALRARQRVVLGDGCPI